MKKTAFVVSLFLFAVPGFAALHGQPENLGSRVQALADQGKFEEAAALLEDRLRGLYPDSSANGDEIMANESNLTMIRISQGQYDKAEALFNHIFARLRKDPENNARNIAILVNNISIAYRAHAEYRKGLDQAGYALRNLVKHEPKSPLVEMLLLTQGSLQHELGLNDSAIASYEQCLKLMVAHLGPEHMDIAVLYNNLGEVYFSKADYKKAMIMYEKSRAIFANYWKADDANFSSSYNNMGKTEYKLGHVKKAEELLLKALKMKRSQGEGDDQDLLETYENLAELYQSQGKKPESGKYADLAKKIRTNKNVAGKTGTILNKTAGE